MQTNDLTDKLINVVLATHVNIAKAEKYERYEYCKEALRNLNAIFNDVATKEAETSGRTKEEVLREIEEYSNDVRKMVLKMKD